MNMTTTANTPEKQLDASAAIPPPAPRQHEFEKNPEFYRAMQQLVHAQKEPKPFEVKKKAERKKR